MEKADKLLKLLAERDHSVEKLVEESSGMRPSVTNATRSIFESKNIVKSRVSHIQRDTSTPNYEYNNEVKATRPRARKRTVSSNDPSNANTFEEQVDIVANELSSKLKDYKGISAMRFSNDWLDCILTEDDDMYEQVIQSLLRLDKEQLLDFIRVLLSAMK